MLTADQVADRVRAARRGHTMRAPRSQQSLEGRIGASDLGFCRSYLKLMIQEVPDDERETPDEKFEAFIGSAYGDRMEAAYLEEHPDAIIQASFDATFPSGRIVPCHPDIIDPELNILIDGKTKNGLALVRASKEVDRQNRFQVITYLLGAIQNGLLEEGAQGFLVYADRSGKDTNDHAVEVVLTPQAIEEVDNFVGDAVYGALHDVEVPKDREYGFCEQFCSKFRSCRGNETLAEGVVESEEAHLALKVYLEAKETATAAEKRKKQASEELVKHSGVILSDDGPYEVSQTWINGSSYTVERNGYSRLNVRKKR